MMLFICIRSENVGATNDDLDSHSVIDIQESNWAPNQQSTGAVTVSHLADNELNTVNVNAETDTSSGDLESPVPFTDIDLSEDEQQCDGVSNLADTDLNTDPASHSAVRQLYDETDSSEDEQQCDGVSNLADAELTTLDLVTVRSDRHSNNVAGNVHQVDTSVLGGDYSDTPTASTATEQTSSPMAPADLMLLLLKLKHKLTNAATEDLARLLNILHEDSIVASSIHNLEKNFVSGKHDVQIHHVCKQCGSCVGVVSGFEVCCRMSSCLWKMTVQQSAKDGIFFLLFANSSTTT